MPVEVQGHRGFGDLEPHNTLRAFRAAAKCPGVKSVEFDVQRTKDGVLVVSHGPEVGPSAVPDCTLEELQAVDLGNGESVPLLADVIDTCLDGGLLMNVEIKSGDPMVVDETLALLKERGAIPSCRISSFWRKALQRVIEVAPDVPIGALYNPSTALIDPHDPGKGSVLEGTPSEFAEWFGDHKVEGDSVNLRSESISNAEVAEARSYGKQVMVWFSCAPKPEFKECVEEYKRIIALGADVICCNRPDVLASELA